MNWPQDLAQREAESCGEYWQPRTKAQAAQHLLTAAWSWLALANDCTSMMARRALSMASSDLDRASMLLSGDLATAARELSCECISASNMAGFPSLDGLADKASALADRLEAEIPPAAMAAE